MAPAAALPQQQQQQQQQDEDHGASLWARVLRVYELAQQSGAASSTDTQARVCSDGGIDFVLRVVSALKAKPQGVAPPTATRWAGLRARTHARQVFRTRWLCRVG
jgi:hypothetical protein